MAVNYEAEPPERGKQPVVGVLWRGVLPSTTSRSLGPSACLGSAAAAMAPGTGQLPLQDPVLTVLRVEPQTRVLGIVVRASGLLAGLGRPSPCWASWEKRASPTGHQAHHRLHPPGIIHTQSPSKGPPQRPPGGGELGFNIRRGGARAPDSTL